MKKRFSWEQWSLFYLAFPYFVFFAGWLKSWLAIPLMLLLLAMTTNVVRSYSSTGQWSWRAYFNTQRKFPWKVALIILILGVWVLLSGITGSIFHQNGDYIKHNAILHDLVTMPWPVGYYADQTFTTPLYLVYYLAYYLPATLVGKIFGLLAARWALFLWAWMGVILGMGYFCRLSKSWRWWLVPLFILFSGMDIWGQLFMKTIDLGGGTQHIEWWTLARFWNYQSNTTLIFWTPQHAITGWILTGLFLKQIDENKKVNQPSYNIFLLFLGSLWSPLVCVGIFPIFVMTVWQQGRKREYNWINLTTIPLLFIVFLFYYSNVLHHFSGWVWQIYDVLAIWPKYFIFCLLEFGLLSYFIWPTVRRQNGQIFSHFILANIILALIPFYIFGFYNDFSMKVSIPSLFIVQIVLARFLLSDLSPIEGLVRRFVLLILFFGAITPLSEISRGIHFYYWQSGYESIVTTEPEHVSQYLGNGESSFFRYLGRKAKPQVSVSQSTLNYLKVNAQENGQR